MADDREELTHGLEKAGKLHVIEEAADLSEQAKRRALFLFIERMHDLYFFDFNELPVVFLRHQLGFSEAGAEVTLKQAFEETRWGRSEYCLSLNYMAEALQRMLDPEPLGTEGLRAGINLILLAYSCNQSEEEFLVREIELVEGFLKAQREFELR